MSVRPLSVRIAWLTPVIFLILAATAVPVEFRSPWQIKPGFSFSVDDFAANVLGYVPLGIVLGRAGLLRAAITAALISLFAETSQFAMMHRDPSVIDVAANVLGAVCGAAAARWKIHAPAFRIKKWQTSIAAVTAILLVFGVWAGSGDPVSARGATAPGELEAHWTFDETGGRAALDSSGHGLNGTFRGKPMRVTGVKGGAVKLDGTSDYIDFGHSTALRLAGSMTITAWINSTSYPVDDAAIVSSHDGIGFQLDTTVDRGPRTIGFKLGDECGRLMARYGRTPLSLNTWYYVAGVYDAEARTMDVYLNGELDDGFLLGPVADVQRSSRQRVYVGRRANPRGFEFAGAADDVRIYSRALTKSEIGAVMHGTPLGAKSAGGSSHDRRNSAGPCAGETDQEDAKIPGAAAALGVLAAVACLGVWPSAGMLRCLTASLAAGLLLVPALVSTLPLVDVWMAPLISLAGGASVAFSVRRDEE
ncbi:MAG: LamG-like jellyroll fold domain-containing protein [Bryobacteraceae bacterium]